MDPRAGNNGIRRKINARKIGIANCIGLINEARIFARILRANGFEVYSVICKVAGKPKSSVGIPAVCESIGAAMCNPILAGPAAQQCPDGPERRDWSVCRARQPFL